ncbi:MAG: YqaJ viral recombinase family protein [Clostridia bacterium]|nr:YqaJ viral recombinase family protein [Clostridia bacterium]MBQ3871009.1 YqaJ viral recombinase family protein [Clostridia bacterium]
MIETINDRAAWLEARKKGIQASEAAAILGKSPYVTAYDLYQLKRGKIKDKDLSDNDRVAYGQAAEPLIRGIFALDYPQYEITYRQYDIYRNDDRPYIGATLDGELFDTDTLRSGILEIKTCLISSALLSQEWQGDHIPDQYYVQIVHQLAATGFDFVKLAALLRYEIDGEKFSRIIYRHYERADLAADITYLIGQEEIFWQNTEAGIAPPVKFNL